MAPQPAPLDGPTASTNERVLHFGLGVADPPSQLRIEWPAGGLQQLRGLPAGVTVQVVEGRDVVYVCPQ